VLEGHHLVEVGSERDPEQLVLAAEYVGDGRLTDAPRHTGPGVLLHALWEAQ
jgi:hypothetical protein